MKNTLTTIKVTLLSLLIASSTAFAGPSTTAAVSMKGFKIALVKNATGTEDIVSGNYLNGINNITEDVKKSSAFEKSMGYYESSAFDKLMGLCVANLKMNRLEKAERACTNAIKEKSGLAGRGKHNKYLKALALSNRGIVRYQAHSPLSAIEDFTAALKLNKSQLIKSNIAALKTSIAAHYDIEMSDTLVSE